MSRVVSYWLPSSINSRVSRAHTIWLPALPGGVAFAPPVVELGAAGAAPGTEVRLAFRGATEIVNQDVSPVPDDITTNAADIDPYGDPTPTNGAGNATGAPVFLNSDATWKDDLTALDGSSWLQVRVTSVGNAATNATAGRSSRVNASKLSASATSA